MQFTVRGFVVACLLLSPGITALAAQELEGQVTEVINGDLLHLGETVIRICGINSPEYARMGHFEANEKLSRIIEGRSVRCLPVNSGYGTPCDGRSKGSDEKRTVAQCFVGDADIAALMVESGHACDLVEYSGGRYSSASGRKC